MKRIAAISVSFAIAIFAFSAFAQKKARKGPKLTKKVPITARFQISSAAKEKTKGKSIKKLTKKGTATVNSGTGAAGAPCAKEGEKSSRTDQFAGTCTVLGQERPCTCDVKVSFECKDGTQRHTETTVLSCRVNEVISGAGALPTTQTW
jgi:hypothetical protein